MYTIPEMSEPYLSCEEDPLHPVPYVTTMHPQSTAGSPAERKPYRKPVTNTLTAIGTQLANPIWMKLGQFVPPYVENLV